MGFGPALAHFLYVYPDQRYRTLYEKMEQKYREWKSYRQFDTEVRPDGSKQLTVDVHHPGIERDIARISVIYDRGRFSLGARAARQTQLYDVRSNPFNRLLKLSLNAEAFRQDVFDRIAEEDCKVEEAVLFPQRCRGILPFSHLLGQSSTIDSYTVSASSLLRTQMNKRRPFHLVYDTPQLNSFERELRLALQKDARTERFRALRTLLRDIPRPVLSAMRASGVRTIHMANYLLAGGDPVRQQHRCEAVLAQPVLMGMFFHECVTTLSSRHADILKTSATQIQTMDDLFALNESRGGEPHPLQDLLKTIDDSKGFLEPIKAHLARYPLSETGETLDPVQINALAKVRSWPRQQERSFGIDEKVILDLKKLDPSWLPRSTQSFADFVLFSRMADEFRPFGIDHDTLMRLPRGRWSDYAQRIGSAQAVKDIDDWYNDVFNLMLAPIVLEQIPFYYPSQEAFEAIKGACKAAFCSAYPPMKLLECSARWHDPDVQAVHKEARATLTVKVERTWPALTDRPFASRAGIIVKALSSHQELVEAGERLRHCVGTSDIYWKRCMDGSAHIIALYDGPTGTLLTTVEVSEQKTASDGRLLSPGQHQGVGRRGPTQDEKNAVMECLDAVQNDPDYAPDWARIDSERARVRTIIGTQNNNDPHTRYSGFDPRDPEKRQKAFNLARAFLPPSDRRITPAAIWDRISAAVALNDLQ